VGQMICSIWFPMYCPYHSLRVCVICMFVHRGVNHKWLEREGWTSGLLSHFAIYIYIYILDSIVVVSWQVYSLCM
jgi:hypothetical protein